MGKEFYNFIVQVTSLLRLLKINYLCIAGYVPEDVLAPFIETNVKIISESDTI